MPQSNRYTYDELQPVFAPELAKTIAVRLAPSTVFPQGCVLGELTASPGTFAPYATGNTDGSQNAKLLLKRAAATDASGNITFGTAATGMDQSQVFQTAPAYYCGAFQTTDLPATGAGALDAGAVTALGRIFKGTLTNGLLNLR